VALRALLLCDDGLLAQAALDKAVASASNPDGRDRRLAAEIFYGVLRAEIRIDFLLSRVLRKPFALPSAVRHILRIAVYAMLFQDRVPHYAAISAAVAQTGYLFPKSLSRLVNAALRSVQRMGDDVREPQFYVEDKDCPNKARWWALARYHSIPRHIADMWENAYGRDNAIALLRRSSARPWTGLRLNSRHPFAERLRQALLALGAANPGENAFAFAPGSLPPLVLNRPLADWAAGGVLSFQSCGSQLALLGLGLGGFGSAPWWDACAGQGGKTCFLLERGAGVALCSDTSLPRLGRLGCECRRLMLPVPPLVQADAACAPLSSWSGHILLDVPCSGLGVLARRPEIRRRLSPERIGQHVALQSRILDQTAHLLGNGCCLVYVTCTLNPEENERRVAALLAEHPQFRLVRQWITPFDHPWLEGMYAALLTKGRGFSR
jgi:16S rRNA (cytosine967-C5)-methyltransferase